MPQFNQKKSQISGSLLEIHCIFLFFAYLYPAQIFKNICTYMRILQRFWLHMIRSLGISISQQRLGTSLFVGGKY